MTISQASKTLLMIAFVAAVAPVGSQADCLAAGPERMTLIGPAAVVPDLFIEMRATPPEKFAAQELRAALEKLVGRPIAIRTDYWIKGPPAGTFIAVGKSQLTNDIDDSSLTTEQYVIDVSPKRLAIVGGRDRQRGVLYGVYDFLEQLGVRWYRPEPWGEHIPKRETITLPLGRKVAKPPEYAYRSGLAGGFTRYAESTLDQQEWGNLWALRNRLNGADPGSDPRHGGQVSLGFDHIYYQLIPVEEYFDKHPEYFCLFKGKRRRVNPDATPRPGNPTALQLCLSNSGLQELFAQKIIERARGRTDLASVSFSATPNDACPFCECDACKAMDDPKDPRSMSNRVCAFTNLVARKVAQAVPGARLSLNAYSTWTSPPTVVDRIEPNVLIHIALINNWSDYTKPFTAPEPNWNSVAMKSLRRWKELGASEIYTYEYWSGYGWPGPLPLVRTMADRIRQYRSFNVRGIYNETAPSWGPQGLELYLFGKLIWNPDLDVQAELNLYYRNYYGPAAAPMKAYHESLMKALAENSTPVFSGGRGMHLVMKPALLRTCGTHLRDAERLVKGKALYERRLAGVLAGHEFAARVCEILRMKKRQGIVTKMTAGRGSYLESPKAEAAIRGLETFVHRFAGGDAVFDVSSDPPYFNYLADDILKNDAFGYENEAALLSDF